MHTGHGKLVLTAAEVLIAIADDVLKNKNELFVLTDNELGQMPAETFELVALAVRFRRRPDLCLRALVENWTRYEIVRELY